jgi:hypothetical protein
VAAAVIVMLAAAPARALEPIENVVGPPINTAELQGLSCLGIGSLSAAWATIIVFLSPLEVLSAPVVAAAFAAGCGVGALAAPGIHWILKAWPEKTGATAGKP